MPAPTSSQIESPAKGFLNGAGLQGEDVPGLAAAIAAISGILIAIGCLAVIPMLPEKLSNGLCSLNPEVERLCMVCDMLATAKGEVHAYQFYPAVMYSHARFTYTEVAAILANTRGPEASKRKDRVKDLLNLHDVYRALQVARQQRGAVDFETTETQIVCDENGRIEKIVPRTRNDAHKLIEEAMLAANVCASEFLQGHEHPALYRVHEGPTPEKLAKLREFLGQFGLQLPGGDEPHAPSCAARAFHSSTIASLHHC